MENKREVLLAYEYVKAKYNQTAIVLFEDIVNKGGALIFPYSYHIKNTNSLLKWLERIKNTEKPIFIKDDLIISFSEILILCKNSKIDFFHIITVIATNYQCFIVTDKSYSVVFIILKKRNINHTISSVEGVLNSTPNAVSL